MLAQEPPAAAPEAAPDEPEPQPPPQTPSAEDDSADPGPAAEAGPAEPADPGPAPEESATDAELAAEEAEMEALLSQELGTVYVVAPPEEVARVSGSAHVVSEEELEKFENDDVQRVLLRVPGVYSRGEDGFGLRPNIGLRGANSDRSKKVALMEDGVLFGPAPYSAPAAYYFPLTTRMHSVEVIKGPASIRYGPNTIGGALNMVTAPVPAHAAGKLDLALGQYQYGKLHLRYGASSKHVGYVVEGVHIETDGFKELDNGGDTGFDKNEAMLKWRLNSDPADPVYHELELKLGVATELSNETYLGLTDSDFEADPYRRYLASANDRMRWYRSSVEARYRFAPSERIELTLTAYRHDFTRAWRKLNGVDGADIHDVLLNPDTPANRILYEVLTGEQDSTGAADTLLIGTNRRSYLSQGVQSTLHAELPGKVVTQTLAAGVRFHFDRIQRDHDEANFLMRERQLVKTSDPTRTTTLNRGSTRALAAYVFDEVAWERLLFSPGLRMELIWTDFVDHQDSGNDNSAFQSVFIPGLGAWYGLTDNLGFLAGVHQGFSPVSPQAGRAGGDDPEPEKSINYELGARLFTESGQAEVVAFLNDYSNLTGECTFSSGCQEDQLDEQFNGGEVRVYGLESAVRHTLKANEDIAFPLSAAYTLTVSEFLTNFTSDNPQFGDVQEGDQLPYVPLHQASLTLGVSGESWGLDASGTYVSEMREVAGQGDIPESERADPFFMLDLAGRYLVFEGARLYAKLDNVLGTDYIAARRPFGARPGKRRWLQVGLDYEF